MPKARIFNVMQYEKHPRTGEPLLNEEQICLCLQHQSIKRWAYILHDKDVYTEEDEKRSVGELKEFWAKNKDKIGQNEDDFIKNNLFKITGKTKPPHWHIVIQCTQTELNVIAKWLNISPNFIEIPKGNGAGKFLDCVEYLTHESAKQQEMGKHLYEDKEVKANFDFREKLDQRSKNRAKYGRDMSELDMLRYDIFWGGKTLCECEEKYPFLVAKAGVQSEMKKLRLRYLQKQQPPNSRINYYIDGSAGVGKGLAARALARSLFPNIKNDRELYHVVGAKGVAFEGYDGQPVIIWNDRRAYDLLEELGDRGNVFNVFDSHPDYSIQNIKYGSVALNNQVHIINGIQPYTEFIEALAGRYMRADGTMAESETAQAEQVYRRFPVIIPVHENDFDVLVNVGFLENEPERYREYVGELKIRGTCRMIREKLSGNPEVAKKLEMKLMEPVVGVHNKIMDKYKPKDITLEQAMEEFKDFGEVIDADFKVIDDTKKPIEQLRIISDEEAEEIGLPADW